MFFVDGVASCPKLCVLDVSLLLTGRESYVSEMV
jgi:hypothetical protein